MWRILILVGVLFATVSCALFSNSTPSCLTALSPWGEGAGGRINLAQCWDAQDQKAFYTTTQGSQIAPYKIATFVELPNSEKRFLTTENIEKWGYLVGVDSEGKPLSEANADGWPLGFVKDTVQSGEWKVEWIGMTCAACHTTDIHFNKKAIRIDGGPTMGDFVGFITEFDKSLEATYADGLQGGEKFKRYARNFTESPKAILEALGEVIRDRKAWHERNDYKPNGQAASYGYARLDAFGVIFNEISNTALNNPRNNREPDAPVSYPFLWDTHYHDWTQWNGVSAAIPMARNIGQILGVFGRVNTESGESSIRLENLRALQKKVKKLRSPVWPEDMLGNINREKADRGKTLFEKNCMSCHWAQPRNAPLRKIEVTMTELYPATHKEVAIGTDPKMASNAFLRRSIPAGGTTKESIPVIDQLGISVKGVVFRLDHLGEVISFLSEAISAFFIHRTLDQPKLFAYKARPMDGIWATAPYLHNGSVANLYELLLPPEKRLKTFRVGSRTFNPEKVGFVTDEGPSVLDTAIEGNRNTGHFGLEYGSCLTDEPRCDEERWALVEYLKTL